MTTGTSDGLVFVRIVEGSNELMRVRLADGAEQALTSTPEREETWPYWSPVAQRLVFQVSHGPRDSDLMLWSPETGQAPLVETPNRADLWQAQTPQVVRRELLLDALALARQEGRDVTDDVGAVEAVGGIVKLVEGHRDNVKVTVPEDLAVVEALLEGREGNRE